ncbi:alpha/beta fold hydrolase [Haloarchaeobius sp. HRN-SO-5]|uniref:alpha/beta fold hydrolase n=1 Tax=Haloarchaeobius sp. HRN-SO-5 TaxID=3446118 RepID=UPI003EBE37EE
MPVVACNGADTYYEEYGEGRPIVFLHGAWAGLRFFQSQLRGLSDDYRTLAFDFRGHGRSEKTEAGHTLSQYARDLRAFLDSLDVDDAVLVGWSLGALVTWEYVDQYGTDGVRALVDVDMEPAPGDWSDDSEGRYDAEALRDIHVAIQDDHWGVSERSVEALLKEPPSDEVRTMMFDETTRCPPSVMSAIILDATTCDYRDVLTRVDVPTLVCAGTDEKWRTVAAVEPVAELVEDARFELFEESGHCPTVEEPDRFDDVMRDFVNSL